jgi:hypothetical protein
MWFVFMLTISRFLIGKITTDLIRIENYLTAKIGPISVALDWWPKSVTEIGSQNQP